MVNPEDVFTPRSAFVNPTMYVSRKNLESQLVDALKGNQHIIIHGDSGTGKSWLYKKVLSDLQAKFYIANLANASRLGSIAAELSNLVDREMSAVKTGYEEEKKAEIGTVVAKGGLAHKGHYKIGQLEPFEACLKALRGAAGSSLGVLVFDNFETIFQNVKLLEELANLLILCDDERYATYRVHILIVGVPADIKEYYYRTPHHQTVANRLFEMPEVARLTNEQARDLLTNGLIHQLKYSVPDLDRVLSHIVWVTDSIPQMVHEYGLEVSKIAEKNNRQILIDTLRAGDRAWVIKSLHATYTTIESHMNERLTKAGRRNQVLYALGLSDGEQFTIQEIEEIVRRNFPKSTAGIALNIPQTLAQLAGGDQPIVKRSPKGDAYRFGNPRYRMVLRMMLDKTADEAVEIRPLSR